MKYAYLVTYYDPEGNDLSWEYFNTLEEAEAFIEGEIDAFQAFLFTVSGQAFDVESKRFD